MVKVDWVVEEASLTVGGGLRLGRGDASGEKQVVIK